jgi:hypothetical protein
MNRSTPYCGLLRNLLWRRLLKLGILRDVPRLSNGVLSGFALYIARLVQQLQLRSMGS